MKFYYYFRSLPFYQAQALLQRDVAFSKHLLAKLLSLGHKTVFFNSFFSEFDVKRFNDKGILKTYLENRIHSLLRTQVRKASVCSNYSSVFCRPSLYMNFIFMHFTMIIANVCLFACRQYFYRVLYLQRFVISYF